MSASESKCFVFAGPTLNCGEAKIFDRVSGVRILPPVERGDIRKLIEAQRRRGVIAMVDGVFHQALAVGHREIRDAVDRGWEIWGLASMGAIRAYEMRDLGVQGFGRVYRCFFEHEDFRDDEVAVLHEPGPPFRNFSEPLVHVRFWLTALVDDGHIDRRQEQAILNDLTSLWFGHRTMERIRAAAMKVVPFQREIIESTLGDFHRYRVKCRDLSDFLEEQPWRRKVSRRRGKIVELRSTGRNAASAR